MSQDKCLSDQFCDKAPKGFGDHHDGRLKAEDNPEFLNHYSDLLKNNDRVIYMDVHKDQAGIEFLASEKQMSVMTDAGVEYFLLEFSPVVNDHIEAYEKGALSTSEFEDAFFQVAYDHIIALEAYRNGMSIEDAEVLRPYDKVLPYMKAEAVPFLNVIENGKANGIKVRAYDDVATEMGRDALEDTKNAHIDNKVFRRDDAWDSYIHAQIADSKAVILAGAGHVASSYGIDEYMEARGHSVATFHIKNELNLVTPMPDAVYNKPCFLEDFLTDMKSRDPDGYDSSDFTPDLFYNEQTKEISVDGTSVCPAAPKPKDSEPKLKEIEPVAPPSLMQQMPHDIVVRPPSSGFSA